MASRYKGRYDAAIRSEGARGRELTSEFDERAREFDPYADAERASTATADKLVERFGEQFKDLRGDMVGAGRLRTGYGREDEDMAFAGLEEELANVLARNSFTAAGLDLERTGMIGGAGERARGRELDLVSGGLDRETAERNARQQKKGGLLGALGSAAGFAVGSIVPGLGNAAGSYLGGLLGNAAGQYL